MSFTECEENFVTKFGGMVSTSNEILGDNATVTADKNVLWTIEFRQQDEESTRSLPIETDL